MTLSQVKEICSQITANIMGTAFKIRCEHDCKDQTGRIFIQLVYDAFCSKSGVLKEWHGRKWYLSEHMTEDEIIKTAFAGFKAAVEHEVMEGFKVNGICLFNPHINYKELLKISHLEVQRS